MKSLLKEILCLATHMWALPAESDPFRVCSVARNEDAACHTRFAPNCFIFRTPISGSIKFTKCVLSSKCHGEMLAHPSIDWIWNSKQVINKTRHILPLNWAEHPGRLRNKSLPLRRWTASNCQNLWNAIFSQAKVLSQLGCCCKYFVAAVLCGGSCVPGIFPWPPHLRARQQQLHGYSFK